MNYTCIKSTNGLTAGKTYEEQFANPSPINACVKNDDGETRYLPRLKFFIVEPTPEMIDDRNGRADERVEMFHPRLVPVTTTETRREIEDRLENLRFAREFGL